MAMVKLGDYVREIDLISYMLFRNSLEVYINSFIPKMFYDIQYNKSLEKLCILVPRMLVSEIGEGIKEEIVGDLMDLGD